MDDYTDFLVSALALRRVRDAASWERLGALGVAADPYEHQIQNVLTILDAPDIRHLIADEVGLGKTVQALMVLNVLKREDPSLRVAIVAPRRISYQWQVELSARGHISAEMWTEDTAFETIGGGGYFHIIKSDLVRPTPIVPDPAHYDMLIVDEPHILSLEQARFLSGLCRSGRNGSKFRHVLLLTATPRLGSPDWARAVFGMIETDRANLANQSGQEMDDVLKELGRDCYEMVSSNRISAEAAMWAVTKNRRILRQTRAAWPNTAPKRRIKTILSKPNDAEMARVDLANKRLAQENLSRNLQVEGAPLHPARQLFWARETMLRALRHDTFSALQEETRNCVDASLVDHGDTLFEDLCDLLLNIWERDAERRVIIVAGDTPTVDSLKTRLSRMFPELEEDDLIATMRGGQKTSMVDVVGAVHSGARLLVLEEVVEAGLNLHHFADELIFYNLPWSIARVDQLIGRLDRLRLGGFKRAMDGKSVGEITIWRMVLEQSPDHRVLRTMDRLGVFDAPLPYLEDETISRLENAIARAASGFSENNENELSLLGELSSGVEQSKQLLSMEALPQVAPKELLKFVLIGERDAVEVLNILSNAGAFRAPPLSSADMEKVRLLKYPPFVTEFPLVLGDMDERNGEILRTTRSRLNDPKKDVMLKGDQVGRRARFFSTGDALHDDLIGQLCSKAEARTASPPQHPIGIQLPNGALLNAYVGSTVAISVAVFLPGSDLLTPRLNELEDDLWEHGRVDGLRRIDEWLLAGLEADRRWLRLRFDASLYLEATVIQDGGEISDLDCGSLKELLAGQGTPRAGAKSPRLPKCEQATEVFSSHFRKFQQSEKGRLVEKRVKVIKDFQARSAVLAADTEVFVKGSVLTAERLAQQKNATQNSDLQQMLAGQIAAEKRRVEARRQAADLRTKLLSQDVAKMYGHGAPIVARSLIRLFAAD
ncbi:SNF2-related protein [Roseovarius sp. CH_XMU1461]|uniref:SNF2-related protein n=1 Tax=Roseovarius sp. CH_XMU1461 TaxID=3107777 RepID=UPI00300BB519